MSSLRRIWSLFCQSWHVCETWTLLAFDIKRGWNQAFHMKCQRHIAKIRSSRPSSQLTLWTRSQSSRGQSALQALLCDTDLSLGRLDPSLTRCPDRPRNRWLDQLRRDNRTPPADLWRCYTWTLRGDAKAYCPQRLNVSDDDEFSGAVDSASGKTSGL